MSEALEYMIDGLMRQLIIGIGMRGWEQTGDKETETNYLCRLEMTRFFRVKRD